MSELPQPTKIKRTDVRNTAGVIGVARVKENTRSGKLLVRYVASWPERNGERGKATFTVGYIAKKKVSDSLLLLDAKDCERELGDIG